jgi:VanZ family protein
VVSIALGGLLEIWQSALPTRQAEGLDWVADSVGALLVTAMLWWHGRVGELGERPTA